MFAAFRFMTGFLAGGGNTVVYVLFQEKIGNQWWAVTGRPGFSMFDFLITLSYIALYRCCLSDKLQY